MKKAVGLFLVVFFALFFFVSCDESIISDSSTSGTGSLCGKVVYSNSDSEDEGCDGIIVTLDKSNGLTVSQIQNAINGESSRTVVAMTTTDSNGLFAFSNLEPGTYTVCASSSTTKEKSVFANVSVSNDQTSTVPTMTLTSVVEVRGNISLDGNSAGNSGFVVFIAGTSLMGITDDSGSYTIYDVPTGMSCNIAVSKGDFTKLFLDSFTTTRTTSGTNEVSSFTVYSSEINDANESMVWKGSFSDSSQIQNPRINWAFYNTTDGCSYIYDGSQWTLLASKGAQGEQGEQGIQGEQGLQGETGAKGAVGITWKGSFASEPNNPSDGWAYYNRSTGCSYIYFGQKWCLLAEKGDKGDTGADGAKGEKGDTGSVGAAGADGVTIIWKGSMSTAPENPELYWAYFDSTEGSSYIYNGTGWDMLAEKGEQGIQGETGAQGEQGIQGVTGADGVTIIWKGSMATAPENPSIYWAYFNSTDGCSYIYNGTSWDMLAEKGEQGIQGETGAQGEQGIQGETGADGVTIIWKGSMSSAPASPSIYWAYFNSTDGCSYIYNGTSWDMLAEKGEQGIQGETGAQGEQGIQGETGAAGADGVTIIWKGSMATAPENPSLYWAYFNSTDGSSYIYNGTSWDMLAEKGEQGIKGDTGAQGEQGIQGETGAAGADGVTIIWKGSMATAPENPSLYWAYFNSTDGSSYIYNGTSWDMLAEKGEQGIKGDTGAQGEQGLQGATGPAGVDGTMIIWKGSYATSPENPDLYWAYYNTDTGCSYIYNGTHWDLLAEKGDTGEQGQGGNDGNSIEWKGSSSTAPSNPELYWAYYNTVTRCSYIYNGSQWDLLASNASDSTGDNTNKLIYGNVSLAGTADSSGAIITAIDVTNSAKFYSAMPNSSGAFSLSGIEAGTYLINIAARGYKAVTVSSVDMTTNDSVDLGSISLESAFGTLTGQVLLEGFTDYSGVKVSLNGLSYEAITDASGIFTMRIPVDTYTCGVLFERADFSSQLFGNTVIINNDQTTVMNTINLAACSVSRVYGVFDLEGFSDDSGISVRLANSQNEYTSTTLADGAWSFDHVAVGTYELTANKENMPSFYSTVKIESAPDMNIGTIKLTPNASSITGYVKLDGMSDHSGIEVRATRSDAQMSVNVVTGIDGSYYLSNISSDYNYTITYSKDGWNTQSFNQTDFSPLEVRDMGEITLVDTTAPVLTEFTINNGANTSDNNNVTFAFTAEDNASGISKILVSYDNFATISSYVDYSDTVTFALPAENRQHTVYVKLRDGSGNISGILSGTITLTDQKYELRGALKGDALHLTKANSPYIVTANCNVEPEDTLIIDPGVDILFSGEYGISVEGKILAIGTEAEMIHMYGVDEGVNKWKGIKVENSNLSFSGDENNLTYIEGSKFQYVQIDNCYTGLSGYMWIENCVVNGYQIYRSYSQLDYERAISSDGCKFVIKDSVITGNTYCYSEQESYVINSRLIGSSHIRSSNNQTGITISNTEFIGSVDDSDDNYGYKTLRLGCNGWDGFYTSYDCIIHRFNSVDLNSNYNSVANYRNCFLEDINTLTTSTGNWPGNMVSFSNCKFNKITNFNTSGDIVNYLGCDIENVESFRTNQSSSATYDCCEFNGVKTIEISSGGLVFNCSNLNDIDSLIINSARNNVKTFEVRNAYWGADHTTEIETVGARGNLSFISDYFDDITKTEIVYSNYVSNPYAECGYSDKGYIEDFSITQNADEYACVSINPNYEVNNTSNGLIHVTCDDHVLTDYIFSQSLSDFTGEVTWSSLSADGVISAEYSYGIWYMQVRDENGAASSIKTFEMGCKEVGPAGGLVFYDCDADNASGNADGLESATCGWRFIEVSPEDLVVDSTKTFKFGYYRTEDNGENLFTNGTTSFSDSNCTKSAIGAGKANTELLVSKIGESAYTSSYGSSKTEYYDAKLANDYVFGGYEDWFLPSRDELVELSNKGLIDLLNLRNHEYASSFESESNTSYFYYVYFDDSYHYYTNYRDRNYSIRCVRYF